jgi:phenylpropionate dioxygenase-like ring-hydroxylating dioxygenase large terminal subunit
MPARWPGEEALMDHDLVERLRSEMRSEFARTAPPDGFPAFHDIPVGRHISDEFWELEQRHLWPKVWVLAGRADDVANPGDYFLFDELQLPIIVVRGKDAVVRAFYNTCQHRGAPVVRDPVGNARALRCQYHSWTYDITTGALVNVPDERDFVGLDKAERCLPALRCEEWDGWLFVNRDPDAPPLREWLGPVADQLAELQGSTLRTVARRSETVACNWKITAEAFLEVYHFRHIHSRNGETQLDNRGATMGLLPNGASRMITPFSRSACAAAGMAGWDDWRHTVAPGFGDIPTVNDMIRSTSSAYSVFPNLITPLAAYGFPFITFWPIDKRTTQIIWTHYAPIDFDPADGLPPVWQKRMDTFDQIMAEDFANLAPMQRSLESPAMRGIPINYQERRIWHFHEQLDRMIGIDRIPAELRVAQLLDRYVER